jgi:hypothetical protein
MNAHATIKIEVNRRAIYRLLIAFLMFMATIPLSRAQVACNGLPNFADGLEPAQMLHVHTSGSDTESDGSIQSPFATVRHAVGLASPVTAVHLDTR